MIEEAVQIYAKWHGDSHRRACEEVWLAGYAAGVGTFTQTPREPTAPPSEQATV